MPRGKEQLWRVTWAVLECEIRANSSGWILCCSLPSSPPFCPPGIPFGDCLLPPSRKIMVAECPAPTSMSPFLCPWVQLRLLSPVCFLGSALGGGGGGLQISCLTNWELRRSGLPPRIPGQAGGETGTAPFLLSLAILSGFFSPPACLWLGNKGLECEVGLGSQEGQGCLCPSPGPALRPGF